MALCTVICEARPCAGRLELLSRQPLDCSGGDQNPHYRAQPYRHLSKVLREMGYEKEARKVLIGLEEERDWREPFSKPERCFRHFYSMTLRYRLVAQTSNGDRGDALLFGWLFVGLGDRGALMVCVAGASAPETVIQPKSGQPSPMLYSLDALLPIDALRQEDSWWPEAERWRWCFCAFTALPWGYILRVWLCVQIVLGWILTGLMIAGFAGIVRRE